MKKREEHEILEQEKIAFIMDSLKAILQEARINILKILEEYQRGFDKKRKKTRIYADDLLHSKEPNSVPGWS